MLQKGFSNFCLLLIIGPTPTNTSITNTNRGLVYTTTTACCASVAVATVDRSWSRTGPAHVHPTATVLLQHAGSLVST